MIVDVGYKYGDITRKVIGCAMEVHNALGSGFQELIYQRALAIAMAECGLQFIREKEMDIFFKNQKVGTRRVDFFVENVIVVELKAITKLENVHLAQTINYVEAFNMDIGLLINFGNTSLQFKRAIKPPSKIRHLTTSQS